MIGKKIKDLRIKNNLTQSELADKLYVSDKTISSWEGNRTTPDIDTILKICEIFNTNPYSLMNNNSDNLVETEIKLKVGELEYNRILSLIKDKSVYLGTEKQSATYYSQYNKPKNDEFLRIRSENGKNILNYKKRHNKYCDEYEVVIDNQDNLKKIFELLNFKEIALVDKERIKYLYQDKYEIAFDKVKDLGLFIEIEVKKYDLSPVEEYSNLLKLLKNFSIDLNLISTKRYPEYFMDGDNND